jgi:hypothetical protein
MSSVIAWMGAEAERPEIPLGDETPWRSGDRRRKEARQEEIDVRGLPAHQFPAKVPEAAANPNPPNPGLSNANLSNSGTADRVRAGGDLYSHALEEFERDRQRRVYRGRAVSMLRRYMRYSLETGRLPSLLGREFFRATVTKYRVSTFEDRVIFVHDMEICLGRLDEFSRQVLGRVVLQEYDHAQAGRLLGCTRMTVHRKLLEALDLLSSILIEFGLLDAFSASAKNSCQEGETGDSCGSDCEDGK